MILAKKETLRKWFAREIVATNVRQMIRQLAISNQHEAGVRVAQLVKLAAIYYVQFSQIYVAQL